MTNFVTGFVRFTKREKNAVYGSVNKIDLDWTNECFRSVRNRERMCEWMSWQQLYVVYCLYQGAVSGNLIFLSIKTSPIRQWCLQSTLACAFLSVCKRANCPVWSQIIFPEVWYLPAEPEVLRSLSICIWCWSIICLEANDYLYQKWFNKQQ